MITQQILHELFLLDKDGNLVRKKRAGRVKPGSYSLCKDKDGYIVVGINKKNYRAHRLVWLYVHGELPKCDIDHINRIKDDNRPENLRLVNKSQNRQNINMQKNNKSGLKGVWLHKQNKSWCASISINKKNKHIGCFETKEEAAAAYIAAAKILHECNIF